MSWRHVFIIVAALAMDLACGMISTCNNASKSIDTLATMVIGGVLGNMQAGISHKKLHNKKILNRGANV